EQPAFELRAEVLCRLGPARADVAVPEDLLVAEDPFARVLAVVVVRLRGCFRRLVLLLRGHGVPSSRGVAAWAGKRVPTPISGGATPSGNGEAPIRGATKQHCNWRAGILQS